MNTTIQLPNGRTAINFVPEDSKELCIVPLSMIKRLTENLKNLSFEEIKRHTISKMIETKSLKPMVEYMEDEITFHRTVNLIEKYEPANEPEPVHNDANQFSDLNQS